MKDDYARERFQDRYVQSCPYCGGMEMIEAMQSSYGAIYGARNQWNGRSLYHTVCRSCGSVVRSYVKEPEKLLPKKERRQE